MDITCGIFLFDKNNKLLIGKSTGGNNWSIPKGLIDVGEEFSECAVREFVEETGIVLNKSDITFIDKETYKNKKKVLYAYVLKSDKTKEEFGTPICNSMVFIEGRKPFPEINKFEWVTIEEAIIKLHHTQINILKNFFI